MVVFSMRPHTFVVSRNTGGDSTPPTKVLTEIISGACNTQTNPSGNIGNAADVMNYDYVLFYDFELDEDGNRIQDTKINVEDIVVTDIFGDIKTGKVMKWMPGQLSNRIWFNEISK